MKWLDGYRIRLMLVGIMAAIALGGGRANADFTFGEPTNLGPTVNTSRDENGLSISADGLTVYFGSARSGGEGDHDIYQATRPTVNEPFGDVMSLGPGINTVYDERPGHISDDGPLYITSDNLLQTPKRGDI